VMPHEPSWYNVHEVVNSRGANQVAVIRSDVLFPEESAIVSVKGHASSWYIGRDDGQIMSSWYNVHEENINEVATGEMSDHDLGFPESSWYNVHEESFRSWGALDMASTRQDPECSLVVSCSPPKWLFAADLGVVAKTCGDVEVVNGHDEDGKPCNVLQKQNVLEKIDVELSMFCSPSKWLAALENSCITNMKVLIYAVHQNGNMSYRCSQ
jgi:hypothetical protein